LATVVAGVVYAQYPIMDMVANKVVQKHQSMSCEQLWENRGKQASPEEQRIIGLMKSDLQMREQFLTRLIPL
jgi:hypothetical protein